MKNKKEARRYHNGYHDRNLRIIFARMQAIQEEKGLVSRVDVSSSDCDHNLEVSLYNDPNEGMVQRISYYSNYPKKPNMGKNLHRRTRTPRPSYDLSIEWRCEKRRRNQKFRNRPLPKIDRQVQPLQKPKQMSYSVYITQTYMPPGWKNKGPID